MSRKKFIEKHGGTCRNWIWSWSFVNHDEKLVLFGCWDHVWRDGAPLILEESWQIANGRKQPGYAQAIEHLALVESGEYKLVVFRQREKNRGNGDNETAQLDYITDELLPASLERNGSEWIAKVV